MIQIFYAIHFYISFKDRSICKMLLSTISTKHMKKENKNNCIYDARNFVIVLCSTQCMNILSPIFALCVFYPAQKFVMHDVSCRDVVQFMRF